MNHKPRQLVRVIVSIHGLSHRARDCVIVRCPGDNQCPDPNCDRILFSLSTAAPVELTGMSVTRDCPRRKSVLCEVELEGFLL